MNPKRNWKSLLQISSVSLLYDESQKELKDHSTWRWRKMSKDESQKELKEIFFIYILLYIF